MRKRRHCRAPAGCGVTRTRGAVRAEGAPARRAEDAAIDDRADVHAVDFDDRLCTTDTCATNRGRFFVFRDGGHLSVDGALELTPTFATLIDRYAEPTSTGG